ncbi:OmpA family protein [Mucilaginibacter sp. AW1-3]
MKIINLKLAALSIATAMTLTVVTSCDSLTKTQKGTAIGAGAGGTIGAIIGRKAGNTALGAIIGGAIGGTAGAFIGRNMDKQAAQIKQTVPGAEVVREGEGIIVKFSSGILFDIDKTNLQPQAKTDISQLAASLKSNPETNILVVGHTDNTGSAAHNMDLSIRRAEAVKAFAITNGIDPGRLSTQGKGDTEPIADNTTIDGRTQNRRVEIVIVANDQMKNQAKQQSGGSK